MNRFNDFYRGRRVLVTGSTGFKGSWLCLWLSQLDAIVTGYALPADTTQPLFAALDLPQKIRQVYGDITDRQALLSAVKNARPEIVFHLAAQPLVLESYKHPRLTFLTNSQGTVDLLDIVRCEGGVRAIVVVTTDKCYANKGIPVRFRESDPLGGKDPYSASKACSELIAAAYRDSFFLTKGIGIATARAGNVIGGGDYAPYRIVPDCISKLRGKEIVELRNPQAIRPWQHVLDPLGGYLLLGIKLVSDAHRFSEAWNFGPSDQSYKTVRELVEKICKRWGSGSFADAHEDSALHEEDLLALDTTKSSVHLGWHPLLDLDGAVSETVTWYRDVESGSNPLLTTIEQIDRLTDVTVKP